jgi:2-oxoglutarate ferredoxin oxidoreductase subunit gamma
MVLGGYLSVRSVVSHESVVEGLRQSLPERALATIPGNEQAMKTGAGIIRKAVFA